MGCDSSSAENAQSIEQHQFVDIPLLSKPKPTLEREQQSSRNFFGSSQCLEPRRVQQPSLLQTSLVDHMHTSVNKAPDAEQSRQQKFMESFVHIEARTFQTIPMMSMPHLQPSRFDRNPVHRIEDYCRFMDQVLASIASPLGEMEVPTRGSLVTVIQ
jgi:hypothetical protein